MQTNQGNQRCVGERERDERSLSGFLTEDTLKTEYFLQKIRFITFFTVMKPESRDKVMKTYKHEGKGERVENRE